MRGVVTSRDDSEVVVTSDAGQACTIDRDLAETVSVTADPSPPPRVALPEQLVISKDRYGR
jgi:DtxR family Mn-dependent transcriptional regulator